MFCQKCKTPLRLDNSLDNLNPASFKLEPQETPSTIAKSSRVLYTPGQKKLYEKAAHDGQSPVFKRSIGVDQGDHLQLSTSYPDASNNAAKDKGAMSFVMLTESQVTPPPPPVAKRRDSRDDARNGQRRRSSGANYEENVLSHKMETTARLFEILSSRSDIDHPICVECTDLLIEGMEKRLENATKERDAYAEFLKNASVDIPTDDERQQARDELAAVHQQERASLAELEALEAEKASLEATLASLDASARAIDAEEVSFWRERNEFAQTLSAFQKDRDSVNLRYDHDARQLERLQRTNVYNDVFNISHDGLFGTINGLRLGRLSTSPVDWAEINAALGQTALLLATVADKLGYAFTGYRLHPAGSTSTIDKLDTSSPAASSTASAKKPTTQSLPLYHSSDITLGLSQFLHKSFDRAMEALLDCIRQLGRHVERATAEASGQQGLRLPYDIVADRIRPVDRSGGGGGGSGGSGRGTGGRGGAGAAKVDEVSIKLGGFNNGSEAWTRACKYTLTCCKFLLAHASNVGGAQQQQQQQQGAKKGGEG